VMVMAGTPLGDGFGRLPIGDDDLHASIESEVSPLASRSAER
jgi:hypothetical protein